VTNERACWQQVIQLNRKTRAFIITGMTLIHINNSTQQQQQHCDDNNDDNEEDVTTSISTTSST